MTLNYTYYSSSSWDLKSLFGMQCRQSRTQWLAGIALERYDEEDFKAIPATDPSGAEIRSRIMNGITILWHLADMAYDVQNECLPATAERPRGAKQRHHVWRTLDLWKQFVRDLSYQRRIDYYFMRHFLEPAFHHRICEDISSGWYFTGAVAEALSHNSWFSWYIFCNGPSFFESAWSNLKENRLQL